MELFSTDRERLAFLLETDTALDLDFEALEAQAEAAAEEPSPEQRPKYITNYIGSKQKLVDWIWNHTPDGVESVADAFSGSAVVAYMYKTKGLRVLANDRLRYCYHAARAIIENDKVRLSEKDLEALLADNAKAGTFVRDNFKGIFFAKGVHGLIDTIRANVDNLSGFKKDIALFALRKTCMPACRRRRRQTGPARAASGISRCRPATASGGRGKATIDKEEAVALMLEKYEVVCNMYHGFDYKPILLGKPAERMAGIASAMEHILTLEDGKKRYLHAVTVLSKAFALTVPHEETVRIRDEVGFFQEVRSALAKATVEGEGKTPEGLDTAIRQLISKAIVSEEVVDIFAAAGPKKPDISILSDEFLAEVQQLPQRNLAVELLQKLLKDEIKTRMRKNVVQARSFAQMIEEAILKYQNRTIEAAQVIS